MTTFEYVEKAAYAAGLNIHQLEIRCGLSQGAIRKWKTVKPSPKSAIAVADYLQIPVEYIIDPDKAEPAPTPITPSMTKQEEELIELYRSLSLRGQVALVNYALSLAEEDKQ